MKKEILRTSLQSFLHTFDAWCEANTVDLTGINVDHICYKCSSHDEYEKIRAMCEFDEAFVYQSIISKRRIAVIGLKEPLQSASGTVSYLELSDQKLDHSQISGVDHIEPIPSGISYEEMLRRFSLLGIVVHENIKPHHTTHDIQLPNGVKIKLSRGKLIEKIYTLEMTLPS